MLPLSPHVPAYSPLKLTKKLGAWSARKGDDATSLPGDHRALWPKSYSRSSDSMSTWTEWFRTLIIAIYYASLSLILKLFRFYHAISPLYFSVSLFLVIKFFFLVFFV